MEIKKISDNEIEVITERKITLKKEALEKQKADIEEFLSHFK